jgi:hypothetical protein
MTITGLKTQWIPAAGATVAVGALVFTFGYAAARGADGVSAQMAKAEQTGMPVVVSCEPHQRALVRPVVLNGAAVSQVECVSAEQPAGYRTARASQPAYEDLADASVVPVRTRPVSTRQVVYDAERRPASRRSVTKSAIIIGSSAGVGAGVGAAIGGKKGALIGLAIGGGSAAVWDQVTRR